MFDTLSRFFQLIPCFHRQQLKFRRLCLDVFNSLHNLIKLLRPEMPVKGTDPFNFKGFAYKIMYRFIYKTKKMSQAFLTQASLCQSLFNSNCA